jgi:hypothetical protein
MRKERDNNYGRIESVGAARGKREDIPESRKEQVDDPNVA